MRQLAQRFLAVIVGGSTLIGCRSTNGRPEVGCTAQVTGTYDFVVLARRSDGTLWVPPNTTHFTRIDGPSGPLLATDSAASGSSAYDDAIGCAVSAGNVGERRLWATRQPCWSRQRGQRVPRRRSAA